jgi:predicted ester cyclase
MKKLFAGLASAALFIIVSCTDQSSSSSRPASDSSAAGSAGNQEKTQAQKNSENMKAVYSGIEKGDMSAMDAFVSADVIDHDTPKGEVKGLDSIKKMLGDMHNHFSDMKIDLIAEATDGDYHFALTRFKGTTKNAMMGAPANTPVDEMNVDVVKLSNGKVIEHWGFERAKRPQMGSKKR